MDSFPPFQPHPLVRGGHAQTIVGCYLPGKSFVERAVQHILPLSDGDTLILHEDVPALRTGSTEWRPGDRVCLLLHGLGGCHQSPYMQRCAGNLVAAGVRVFRLDHRGCGAGLSHARHAMHAGRSEDVASALAFVQAQCPGSPVTLVGYSLSGNMVLKMVGEMGLQAPARISVMAICPSIDLMACSANIERKRNWLYNRSFLQNLLAHVVRRRKAIPEAHDRPLNPVPRRLREFDTAFTAPLGGFSGAEDYYRKASSIGLLSQIAVPTLILAAADDPIVPIASLQRAQLSESTRMLVTTSGGHLGFFGRSGIDPDRRWMDWRIVQWVLAQPSEVISLRISRSVTPRREASLLPIAR